jgi:Secretion system C-terminal sorting domain
MTATDKAGCSVSISKVVTVTPIQLTATASQPSITCSGSTYTLTLGGAATYTVNPGVLTTTTSTLVIANVPSQTTYTITGSNATNTCTGSTTLTVNGGSSPAVYCNCINTFTPSAHFEFLAPAANPGLSRSSAAFVTDLSTYNAGAGTAAIPVSIVGGITTIGSTTAAVSNILLGCNLLLSTHVKFVNCNIKVLPTMSGTYNNAQIVTNGYDLTVDNTTIQACDQMWQGIISTGAGSNKITIKNNSKLQDMIQGVAISNSGAVLDASNSTFENNLVGIHINTPIDNAAGKITGNTFMNVGGLLAPNNSNGQVGKHGIMLTDVVYPLTIGGTTTGLGNMFQNLENGIYFAKTNAGPLDMMGNSTVNVGFVSSNNQFIDIVGGPEIHHFGTTSKNLYNAPQGCGIYVYNYQQGIKNPLVKPIASTYDSRYDNFDNVTKGIVANVGNGTVNHADMLQVQCGIMNNFTDVCRYNISENRIADAHLGIQFVGNSGNGSVVQNNQIDLNENYLVMTTPKYIIGYNVDGTPIVGPSTSQAIWPIGIDVQHTNNAVKSQFWLGGNLTNGATYTVTADGEDFSNVINIPGRRGIGVRMNNAGAGYDVNRNTVRMLTKDGAFCTNGQVATDPVGMCGELTGYQVSNAVGSRFRENKAKTDNNFTLGGEDFNAFYNRPSTGFLLANSIKLTLHCNTMSNLSIGFLAQGACGTGDKEIAGNLMNNHKLGWYFRSYTGVAAAFSNNIGSAASGDVDNKWNGSYFSLGNSAFAFGSCKVFRYDMTAIAPALKIFNKNGTIFNAESKASAANKEYKVFPTTVLDQQGCTNPSNAKANEADVELDESLLDLSVGSTGINYPLFDPVADFIDRANAYRALDVDPMIRASSSLYSNFYSNNTSTNLGKLRATDLGIEGVLDSTALLDSSAYRLKVNQSRLSNASVVPSNNFYENCEQWMNDLYIQIRDSGAHNIDSSKRLKLAALAQQCPMAFGPCVYKARSLFASFAPGVQYNDKLACAAMLPANKNATNPYKIEDEVLNGMFASETQQALLAQLQANDVQIYPNPVATNQKLNIAYNLSEPAVGTIYDNVGKVIFHFNLASGKAIQAVTIPSLANGVYLVSVQIGTIKVSNFKLTIVD